MTIREFITQKLQAFQLNDVDYVNFEVSANTGLDDDYTIENQEAVNVAMIDMIEGLLFAPRLKSINESGFSMEWDYANLGKYYMWLCRRYGRTPNDDILDMLGLSMIIDRTHIW